MTPPLLLLSMLVGVKSLTLLSPRPQPAAMAPPLLTRHTTPSLRLLRPPRLCMASVPPASEGSPEVGLPLSMTRVQLKYFVLLLLVLQNSVVALVTQATRMKTGVMYSGTAAVLASEVLKMPVCLALIARDVGVAGVRRELHQKVVEPWRDTLTMAVPALCYCLQNALFFVALSNLSAASYQLWSQSKTLSTALFFVLLLGKRLRKRQWFALVLLTAGVALVQYADTGTALRVGRPLVGILAVLASSLLSGFSNVYLEKRIKLGDSSGSGRTVRRAILNRCNHVTPLLPQLSARVPRRAQVSIWIRNVQLGLFSIPQSAALCLADRAAVTSAGIGALFAGFSPAVWSVVGLKAFGGLLVAAVVKYADNILKTYVAALSNPNALSWAPKPHTAQIRRQVCDRDFDRANVPAIACALWHAALHRVRYRCCANRAVGAALQLIMLPAIVPPGFHHRKSAGRSAIKTHTRDQRYPADGPVPNWRGRVYVLSTGGHAGSPSLLPAATSSPSGATSLSTLKAWSAPTTASTMADTLLRPHPFSLSGPMKKTRMPTQRKKPWATHGNAGAQQRALDSGGDGHAAHALAALDGQELEVRVNPFVRNADQWQLVLHFYHERSQSENDCVD